MIQKIQIDYGIVYCVTTGFCLYGVCRNSMDSALDRHAIFYLTFPKRVLDTFLLSLIVELKPRI